MTGDMQTHFVDDMASKVGLPGAAVEIEDDQSSGSHIPVQAAIEVAGLRKSYGGHVILDGIDLSVPEGTMFSLLGPNGAGKTTMVRILSTLTAADAGEVLVDGHDVHSQPMAVRSVIGVTGQFSAVDDYLSAGENLLLMADLWHLPRQQGRKRAAELLDLFDLAGTGAKPAYTFSGGMQRRLDLAMTLVGSPRIIFLDEPTTGLDPRGRLGMWDLIRNLVRDRAVTILLTTQYLEEADQLADQVAVLDRGQIVAQGTPQELKNRVPGGHLLLTFTSQATLDAATHEIPGASRPANGFEANDEDLTLQVPTGTSAREVLEVLGRIDVDEILQISLHTPDLNDVFLALTGQSRKEET